jgi:hypothetical protein
MSEQPQFEIDPDQMIAVLREEVANLNDQRMHMTAIIRTQQQALATMRAHVEQEQVQEDIA